MARESLSVQVQSLTASVSMLTDLVLGMVTPDAPAVVVPVVVPVVPEVRVWVGPQVIATIGRFRVSLGTKTEQDGFIRLHLMTEDGKRPTQCVAVGKSIDEMLTALHRVETSAPTIRKALGK